MKKGVGFILVMMCMLALTGCGDVATLSDPDEQYTDHLEQVTERTFMDEDGIESADATVSYDEGTEQYSIELSIITNGELDKEQIGLYKDFLNKTYVGVILVVDGEVM